MASPTRAALVTAAADLLDEGGLEAVTLRAVSHRAGVSHNAPYKHFADKEMILASVAAEELRKLSTTLTKIRAEEATPESVLRAAMREYAAWALAFPARFKLVFGVWTTGSVDLAVAATESRTILIDIVATVQNSGSLPAGDPERVTALLQALVHGAVDLALIGHLASTGKGHAGPTDLIDDLLHHLRISAAATPPG